MKKRVLVFPCGSEIGLEIHRSLYVSTHFELVGGSSAEDHGQYVYKNYIGNIPHVEDEDFIEKLNQVITEMNIDFIIPAHDSVVLKLAQAADEKRLACEVVASPVETCLISRSKTKTYNKFSGIIPTPEIYSTKDVKGLSYPVFLKPDAGQGSKGTHTAQSAEEVAFYTSKDLSLIVLEYLSGTEYTIDCFSDKHGKLLFAEGRQRNRIAGGISVNSSTVDDERFEQIATKINDTLEFRGAWFFQVKQNHQGELVLMEIAPRIAGTAALVRCKGVNLVLLSLFDRLNYDVNVNENDYDLIIDRALQNVYNHNITYKHVYLDFDDLVIVDGQINPIVIAFVYQCVNKNIKIHLLTRHRKNLDESLKKYRLSGVFDDIIWVKEQDEKHSYIKEEDAIFIDDSFSERERVKKSKNIAVFDAHMLESLLEKF